jgi:zinc protease
VKTNLKTIYLIVLISFVIASAATGREGNEQAKFFELENGMKVFLYEKQDLPLLNLVFAFDLGIKDESDETNGLVHILEHYILFRGTEFRSGEEIGNAIRSHGAYFNGHTGLDLATFELSLPSEYADFALENQKEILFRLKLTQEELDKEKQIILEELSQIQDDPIKFATSLIHQNIFQNHPYQRPVHGKREIIEAATVDQIQKFYDSYFVPANSALAVVGDFNLEEMEQKIKNKFSDLENNGFTPQKFEKATPLEDDIEIEEQMDVNIGYLVIGLQGPDYNHQDQYAMDVLTEVTGRGIIPLLTYSLRGRRQLVETISMGFGSYKYGGMASIYLTLDPKNMRAARTETIKFLKNARRLNYSKTDYSGEQRFYALDYLESAKNQIKFRYHQSQEKGLNLALSLAMNMLMKEGPDRGSYIENIDKINSSDLRKAAGEYFSGGKYVVVSIVPNEKKD